MADNWKHIKNKMESGTPPAFEAGDWEAMQQKIDATPSLAVSKSKGGIWFWGAGILLIAMVSTFLWFTSAETSADADSDTTLSNTYNKNEKGNSSNIENDVQNQVGVNENPNTTNSTRTETENIEPLREETNLQGEVEMQNTVSQASNINAVKSLGSQKSEIAARVKRGESKRESESKSKSKREGDDENSFEKPRLTQSSNNQRSNRVFQNSLQAEESEIDEAIEGESSLGNIAEPIVFTSPPRVLSPKEISFGNIESFQNSPLPQLNVASNIKNNKSFNARFGVRISGVNVGAAMLTDFTEYHFGYGLGVDVQKKNWLFQTGLYNYQITKNLVEINLSNNLVFDTIITQTVRTDSITRVDSAYVITGPFMGGYVFDTTITITQDTIVNQSVDSTMERKADVLQKQQRFSYTELPLLFGYRFINRHIGVDLVGGVIVGKATYQNADATLEDNYDMKLSFQPTVRYFIRPEWSVYSSVGVRYQVQNSPILKPLNYSFQVGVSYHW